MISKLLYKLTASLPYRLISRTYDEPYLEQYYVGTICGVTFYLHRFIAPDEEELLHNHPFTWSRVIVLRGSYVEDVVTDLCPAEPTGCVLDRRTVRWYNRIDGNRFHRITGPQPDTWTLFFHGERQRLADGSHKGWGFLDKHGDATVFKQFKPSPNLDWWHTAPKGRDVERSAHRQQ